MTSMAMRKDGPGPFLKWAGGKGRLAPLLASLAPPRIGVYHEPFLGAGALFFHLTRTDRIERARLSDRNEDLISAYRVVRDDTDALLPHRIQAQTHRNPGVPAAVPQDPETRPAGYQSVMQMHVQY